MALSDAADRLFHKMDAARRRFDWGRYPRFRSLLIGPYRKLINLHGRGVLMKIGGTVPARIPPAFAWRSVEDFERESMVHFKKWMESAKEPLLLDIGCSIGFVSCAGLFCNPSARVIAIDADRPSLKITRQLCALAPDVDRRLSLVWGFASDDPTSRVDYSAAHQATLLELARAGVSDQPDSIHYVCLNSTVPEEKTITRYSIDDLISPAVLPGSPILFKCDVEGAELMVLKSAKKLLARRDVTLLLSVHSWQLEQNGATKDEVRAFLSDLGYQIDVIAVDHEEHWWCMKSTAPVGSN